MVTFDDGRNDFDFIFGAWHVRNRKLRDPLDPTCAEWVEFDAHCTAEPVFGGLGHVDRFHTQGSPGGAPFEGFTLRLFDPQTRLWRIWWASDRRPGHLDPPMEGAWADGRGEFHGDDVSAGRLRFTWTHETPTTARWEQASSSDGISWATNWVMELTRSR